MSDRAAKTRYGACLAAIFFVALLVRVAAVWHTAGLDAPPDLANQPDQQYYEEAAQNLARGQGYTWPLENPRPTAHYTPGTSLTLAAAYALFGHSYLVGRLWMCVLSALTCVLLAFVIRPWAGRLPALLGAAMLAFYPNHFYYVTMFLSETPFWFYLTAGLAVLVSSLQRRSLFKDAAAGVLIGAAVLCRAHVVLAVPLGFLAALFAGQARREHLLRMAVLTAGMALVIAPWVVRNKLVMGSPVIASTTGYILLQGHNDLAFNDPAHRKDFGWYTRNPIGIIERHLISDPEFRSYYEGMEDPEAAMRRHPADFPPEIEKDRIARREAVASIMQNLDRMPALVLAKFAHFFYPSPKIGRDMPWDTKDLLLAAGWTVILPLMLLGIWATWRRSPSAAVALLSLLAAQIGICVLYYPDQRYRDGGTPVFVALAAAGAWQLALWLFDRGQGSPIRKLKTLLEPGA